MTSATISTSTSAEDRELSRPPKKSSSGAAQNKGGLSLAGLPAVAWYMVFMLGPLAAMFIISFYDWPGMIAKRTFVGFEKYQQVLTDPVFHQAIINTLIQIIVVVPIMIVLAFMLGYYLRLKPFGQRFLSVMFFTPGLVSISAKSMMFFGLLSPRGGVNSVLKGMGLDSLTHSWLADTQTALAVIIIVDLWSGIGWTAILFSSRLASVPDELYEAASLDGCGHWRTMWKIAYPVVEDFVGVAAMLQFIWTLFNSATIVLLLTGGGPGTSSTTLSYLVYSKAFVQQDIGYSQVVGVLLFAFGFIGMVVIRRVLKQRY